MSSSPNVNISRPRPFASLSRPVRRSTGSAPEEIQRSLTAAVRKISTTSLPAINKLQVSAPAAAPAAAPAPAVAPAAAPANTAAVTTASVNAATTHSQGVTPTPPPDAIQCVAIPPMLPLSPVFSAVSAEPLQPQPLAPNAGRLPSGGVPTPPQTPSTPKRLQDDFQEDFGDKYAALAHLDSAFSDPQASAPSTSIDWNASQCAGEAGEAAETSPGGPGDAAQVEGRGVSSQGHLRGGGAQVVGRTDTPQNPRELTPTPANHPGGTSTTNPFFQHPTPAPAPAPPASLPDTLDLGGDKYAALAALDSTTTVNWGPSPSAEEESEKTGRAPETGGPVAAQAHAVQERTGGINRSSSSGGVVGGVGGVGGYTAYAAVACTGSAPGVLSSSPPSGSMMAAHPHTQAQLYGHPAMYPAAPGTGYCTPTPAPTPMYHHPPTPHPGYAPASNAGFLYPQYPAAQQGIYPVVTTTTAVAGYGAGVVPATVGHPGMGLQGFPAAAAAAAGVGVVQGSGWVPGVGYSVPVPAPASVSASASASASSSSSSSNPFMGSSPQLQKRSPVCMS